MGRGEKKGGPGQHPRIRPLERRLLCDVMQLSRVDDVPGSATCAGVTRAALGSCEKRRRCAWTARGLGGPARPREKPRSSREAPARKTPT